MKKIQNFSLDYRSDKQLFKKLEESMLAALAKTRAPEMAQTIEQLTKERDELLKVVGNNRYHFNAENYTDDLGERWIKYEQRMPYSAYQKIQIAFSHGDL